MFDKLLDGKASSVKPLILVYNPDAGEKIFKTHLDAVIDIFQTGGFETRVARLARGFDINACMRGVAREWGPRGGTVAVSGGDGSVNIVINAMVKHGVRADLGIIPSGTANDLATFLNIPTDIQKAAKIITNGKIAEADLGQVTKPHKASSRETPADTRYFINVCGAGYFTNISHNIDAQFKNALGKAAYYLASIPEAYNLAGLPLKITNSQSVFVESLYFFIVLNSGCTAGFTNIVKDASLCDGLFEFIGIRERSFPDIASLLINIVKGDYLSDPAVLYFKDGYIKIEAAGHIADKKLTETGLDGERGFHLPIEIKNVPRAVNIFV